MNKHNSWLRNIFFTAVVCSSSLGLQGSVAAEVPPLIPREVLFGNPEIAGVDLSPDGAKIAYLAPYQGVMNLWVRD